MLKKKVSKNLKFKCDQCDFTFKSEIILTKHRNTKHGQAQKNLGEGQFSYVFDVRPGNEEEAKALREAIQQQKSVFFCWKKSKKP